MKGWIILFAVIVLSLFVFVQLHFLGFHGEFGIPFGKSDVDNYLLCVNDGNIRLDHVLITLVPYLMVDFISPEMFYILTIPFIACLILPITMFMFAFYFSKRKDIALWSTFILMFGTFSLQVYIISALWAQMLATIFAMWTIIFIRHYTVTGKSSLILASLILTIITALSHPAGFCMIAIFFGMTVYSRTAHKFAWSVVVLCGTFATMLAIQNFTNMFDEYFFKVDLAYVLDMFAPLAVWIILPFGMLVCYIGKDEGERFLIGVTLAMAIASPLFVLWRPLISLLPLVAYFVGKFIVGFLGSYDDFIWNNAIRPIFVIALMIGLGAFTSYVTNEFMGSMLWEMEAQEGISPELPRSLNSTIFRDMYFEGQHVCYIE